MLSTTQAWTSGRRMKSMNAWAASLLGESSRMVIVSTHRSLPSLGTTHLTSAPTAGSPMA